MTPHPLRWPLEPLPTPEPSGHGGTVQSHQRGIAPGGKSPPCASDGGAEPATMLAPVGTARGLPGGHCGGHWVASWCPWAALPRSGARHGGTGVKRALCPAHAFNGSVVTMAKAAVVTGGTRGAPHTRGRCALDPVLPSRSWTWALPLPSGTAGARPHHPAGTRAKHRARRGGGQPTVADVHPGTQMCTWAPRCAPWRPGGRAVPRRQAAGEPLPWLGQGAGHGCSGPLAPRLCHVPRPGSAGRKVPGKLFGCRK